MLLHTPWKLQNHVRRVLALPQIRLYFAFNGVKWKSGLRVFGRPLIQRHLKSEIVFGENLELRSAPWSNPLSPHSPVVLSTRKAGARISIGNGCGMTGTVIVADRSITIGNRVLFGANSVVSDTDFHPLAPSERARDLSAGTSAPIVIEDDVFIGMQAIILKGVTVGTGAVVGAGSVVSKDVAAGTIVAGNPAKVIGRVKE